MQQVLIDDTLLNEAAHCLSLEDTNEVVSIALRELINNHPPIPKKRRQPPVSIAGKGKIIADLIQPCVELEDFECLK
jgi:hypothetical protein